jgi:hypothetical protein
MTCIAIIGTTIGSILGGLVIFSAGMIVGYKHGQNDANEDKNQLE